MEGNRRKTFANLKEGNGSGGRRSHYPVPDGWEPPGLNAELKKYMIQDLLRQGPPSQRNNPKSQGKSKCKKVDTYSAEEVPAQERLTARKVPMVLMDLNNLKCVRDVFPPTALPEWYIFIYAHDKLPLNDWYRKWLVLARGKIGDKLQLNFKSYTVEDPQNKTHVVGREFQSLLHDPNTKEFYNKPHVKALLIKSEEINEFGEVICTLKEFNQYREMIRLRSRDVIVDMMKSALARQVANNNVIQLIKRWEKAELEGSSKRRAQAVANKRCHLKDKDEAKTLVNVSDMMCKEYGAVGLQCRRIMEWRTRHEAYEEKEEKVKARRCKLLNDEWNARRNVYLNVLRKESEPAQRIAEIKAQKELERYRKMINGVKRSDENLDKKAQRDKKIYEGLKKLKKENAIKRDERYRKMAESLPKRMEDRFAEAKRIFNLTLKYFLIWRDKVRKIIAERASIDELHETNWTKDKHNSLADATRKYKQICEYEGKHFSQFVWNVLKLRMDQPPDPDNPVMNANNLKSAKAGVPYGVYEEKKELRSTPSQRKTRMENIEKMREERKSLIVARQKESKARRLDFYSKQDEYYQRIRELNAKKEAEAAQPKKVKKPLSAANSTKSKIYRAPERSASGEGIAEASAAPSAKSVHMKGKTTSQKSTKVEQKGPSQRSIKNIPKEKPSATKK